MRVVANCYDFKLGGVGHLKGSWDDLFGWSWSKASSDHRALSWAMLFDPGLMDYMMDCPDT